MPIAESCRLHKTVRVFIPDLVNMYGCTVGKNTTIGPFVEIQSDVEIGENCAIQSHSFICQYIHVGDNVFIGHGVIFTNDRNSRSHNDDWVAEHTYIHDNVSIGSGAVILPGVTLGAGCVVGAGAVVTKSVKPYTSVVGNPARELKPSHE